MNTRNFKTYLTSIIIVLAILQAPIAYFFTEGFFSVLVMVPYALIGLSLSVWAVVKLVTKKATNKPFHIYGLIIGIAIAVFQYPQYSLIEYFDWWVMRTRRERIIADIKKDRNRVVIDHNQERLSVPTNTLLPISKGGMVVIKKQHKDTLSVEFYTDRGFIDHYKAFVYTNDPIEQAAMERSIKEGKYQFFRKFDDNWFSLHF